MIEICAVNFQFFNVCLFASDGALDSHLDFHTATELCCKIYVCTLHIVMLELLLMFTSGVSFCQIADNSFHLNTCTLCMCYVCSAL